MDKQPSNSKIKEEISYNQIENTPFTMCRKEEEFCLLIGNTQVTSWDTKENTIKKSDIKNINWNTLTTIVVTMVEKIEEIKEIKKLIKEKK